MRTIREKISDNSISIGEGEYINVDLVTEVLDEIENTLGEALDNLGLLKKLKDDLY